jgi:hypothetical protein
MIEITGNTYPVRDQLRKCWLAPEAIAAKAQALVTASKPKRPGGRAPRLCATCRCRINYGTYCGKCEFSR